MKITKDTVAVLQFQIADSLGRLIEKTDEPAAVLIGGYGNTLPAIEAALEGQEAGYKGTLAITPENGFGERDETLKIAIPKKDFPPGVKVGGQLEVAGPDGQFKLYTVAKVKGDTVHLDGNHPLAGLNLKVTLKVVSVRAANPEELAHGHAHGVNGQGHHH